MTLGPASANRSAVPSIRMCTAITCVSPPPVGWLPQSARQHLHELTDLLDLRVLGDEFERRYLDSTRRTRQRRAQRRVHRRELIDEAEQGRPRWRVERREHVEGGASVPRCAAPRMPYQLLAQCLDSVLDVTVDALKRRQHAGQLICRKHADVLME